MSEFGFYSISLERIDRIRPNFVYTSSLTRSSLVLSIVVFRKFATDLRLLIHVRIWFLLHILRMNVHNITKFCIHIIIDKIYVGIVKHHFFCKFATKFRPLIDVRNGPTMDCGVSCPLPIEKNYFTDLRSI